ncbi:MAG: signal peptide peptidase SppA [Planctomycetes bacterium]|nr:signal peptide peptidase SppA [Planctomycetota bacterium]
MIKKLLLLSIALIMVSGCIFLPSLDLEKKWEEQFVTGDESSSDKILILPIQGVIMTQETSSLLASKNACTPDKIQELLKLADDDIHIKAVILVINSPGGGVTASDIIYRTIKEFKQKHPDKPVLALMQDTAASGGYYISCSADYVMAHPTSITGSIGVISMFFALEDLMGKIGVETAVIKSGKAKDTGSPFRKMTAEEKEYMQKIIDEMYNRFLDIVAEARKSSLSRDEIKTIADGRILTGQEALKSKLVDSVGYMSDAYNKTLDLAHLKSAKVIRYQKSSGLFDNMFMGPTPSLELTYLAELVLKTNSSQFMYLWTPEMIGK